MTDDIHIDGISTPGEFEEALGQLLRTAHGNDVDVVGGWDIRADGAAIPDLDVVVTVVGRSDD